MINLTTKGVRGCKMPPGCRNPWIGWGWLDVFQSPINAKIDALKMDFYVANRYIPHYTVVVPYITTRRHNALWGNRWVTQLGEHYERFNTSSCCQRRPRSC